MAISRLLFTGVLLAATAIGDSFASYTGPDNNQYTYKIINWFHKEVENHAEDQVINGESYQNSFEADETSITGIVVLGPAGVLDFSVSKFKFSTFHYNFSNVVWETDIKRRRENYSPSGNVTWDYHYNQWCDDPASINSSGPVPESGSLNVAYPTSISGGTTITGSGFITVVGDAPADIVGVPGYFYQNDLENYYYYFDTVGAQLWATITWTNTLPGTLDPPEDPDFADPEYEEELD